jgi:hypothetical protein
VLGKGLLSGSGAELIGLQLAFRRVL